MTRLSLFDAAKILGVSVDATPDQIKKAYKEKARELHPDLGGDPHEFSKLNQAKNEMIGSTSNERLTRHNAIVVEAAVILEDEELFNVYMNDLMGDTK